MNKQELEKHLQHANVIAFMKMIRCAEGTSSVNGYRYLFGSRPSKEILMKDFTDHPKIYTPYTNKAGQQIKTSAAGAYQIIFGTWATLKQRLQLPDFSPKSQDLAALELIAETGAVPLIVSGKFNDALNKVRKIWASLPGAGANQPEKSLAQVKDWYQKAGGTIV